MEARKVKCGWQLFHLPMLWKKPSCWNKPANPRIFETIEDAWNYLEKIGN